MSSILVVFAGVIALYFICYYCIFVLPLYPNWENTMAFEAGVMSDDHLRELVALRYPEIWGIIVRYYNTTYGFGAGGFAPGLWVGTEGREVNVISSMGESRGRFIVRTVNLETERVELRRVSYSPYSYHRISSGDFVVPVRPTQTEENYTGVYGNNNGFRRQGQVTTPLEYYRQVHVAGQIADPFRSGQALHGGDALRHQTQEVAALEHSYRQAQAGRSDSIRYALGADPRFSDVTGMSGEAILETGSISIQAQTSPYAPSCTSEQEVWTKFGEWEKSIKARKS